MITERMAAGRGQRLSGKIGQAASLSAASGRFVTFEESATTFTDKISGAGFLPFPQGTNGADFDVDATDQNKPLMITPSNVTSGVASADWGAFGSNDFMAFFIGHSVVQEAHTMASATYSPPNSDPNYGCMSFYFGKAATNGYAGITVQPYYSLFRFDDTSALDQIFTPWNDARKWNYRAANTAFAFAAVKRGNEWLHFGFKQGDETGELLGRYVVDAASIDLAFGNSKFSDRWNNVQISAEFGLGHGAYGSTADRCRYVRSTESGEQLWRRDFNGQVCGNPRYPAWTDEYNPITSPALAANYESVYPRDPGGLSYQWPSQPNALPGTHASGAIDYPQRTYAAGMFGLPHGAPNNMAICNSLRFMTDAAIAGYKVADPSLFFGV